MKNFLLDLWHDLRAKRLWPVALALVAGLVAVPVVLSKDAAQPDLAPPPAAKAAAPEPEGPAALAQVKLEELGEGAGSSLSSFDDPSNPFAPPPKVLAALRRGEAGGDAGAGEGSGGGSGSSGGDAKLEGGSLGGGADSADAGGSGDTGSGDSGSGDSGSGETGSADPGAGDPGGDTGGDGGGETTTSYTYVADVSFRANDRRRKIKAMEKLDMLPSASSPLLIFLGVTPDAGNAVFLVDSTLKAAGEGKCTPSPSECAFLYLGPGSEHEFTNEEGDSYTLRVDEIRRVELPRGRKARASKNDNKVANAAVGRRAPARRFALPLLADLVSVSSGKGANSNADGDRR